jgi:hypothetical protein
MMTAAAPPTGTSAPSGWLIRLAQSVFLPSAEQEHPAEVADSDHEHQLQHRFGVRVSEGRAICCARMARLTVDLPRIWVSADSTRMCR